MSAGVGGGEKAMTGVREVRKGRSVGSTGDGSKKAATGFLLQIWGCNWGLDLGTQGERRGSTRSLRGFSLH